MTRDIVSLEQAWFWGCPHCGQENYAKSVTLDLDAERPPDEQIREMFGLESWEAIPEGTFVAAPEVVKCAQCATEFYCFVNDGEHDESGDEDPAPEIPDGVPEDFGGSSG